MVWSDGLLCCGALFGCWWVVGGGTWGVGDEIIGSSIACNVSAGFSSTMVSSTMSSSMRSSSCMISIGARCRRVAVDWSLAVGSWWELVGGKGAGCVTSGCVVSERCSRTDWRGCCSPSMMGVLVASRCRK